MTHSTSRTRICQTWLEDADKPKGSDPSTSKSVGKEDEAQTEGQAAEGAQAPPEEIPPAPTQPPLPHNQVQAQAPTQDPTDKPSPRPHPNPRRGRNKAYSVC